MADDYPYDEASHLVALIADLERITERDPEQEVQGIALPVVDSVLQAVLAIPRISKNPIAQSVRNVVSPEQVASGNPVRALDILIVCRQLHNVIGSPPDLLSVGDPIVPPPHGLPWNA